MPGYCGLCNVTGHPGIPRPDSETIEEFRAHVKTHDPADVERVLLARTADELWKVAPHLPEDAGMGSLPLLNRLFPLGPDEHEVPILTPSSTECWCTCHLGQSTSLRLLCFGRSEDEKTCVTCHRSGKDRYLPMTEGV